MSWRWVKARWRCSCKLSFVNDTDYVDIAAAVRLRLDHF
jgi:hypothetical protein